MVKQIMKQELVSVPSEVTLTIKNKIVTCKGPLGELSKSFKKFNAQLIPIYGSDKKISEVQVRRWFCNKKEKACINSTKKHLKNMIVGVTKGFTTVMKYGYKFFPMTVGVRENNLEIEKFAGRLYKPRVTPIEGVQLSMNPNEIAKEINVSGIDAESVGKTCSLINQSCKYRNVDKRIFIDGIFIFEKKNMK